MPDDHTDSPTEHDDGLLRRLVDASPNAVVANRVIRDDTGAIVDFEITFANAAMRQLFLDDGRQWIGRRLREDIPNTVSDGRYQILVDAIENGSEQVMETDSDFRRGTSHRLVLTAIPRGDEVFVTLRDITTEHHAQLALAASEQRYRDLVEHQAEFVCRFQPDTTLLFVNDAYARYYGSTPEEMVGLSMLNLVPPDRWDEARSVIASLSEQNPRITDEGYTVDADGTIRWQQWTTSAVVIENGQVAEIQAVGIDITDRKTAEMATRARSEALALVSRVSERFIDLGSDQVDAGIEAALADMGEALGADRAYLVMYQPDGTHLDMTHEWCASGVESVKGYIQSMPDTAMPRLRAALRRNETTTIDSMADLDDEWVAEREMFRGTGVGAALVMPVTDGGRLVGSTGFDILGAERHWAVDEVAILGSAAVAFGQVMARRDAEDQLRRSERRYRALVAGVPDLLVRVDRDGTVLDWQPPADSAAFPPAHHIVGRTLVEALPQLAADVGRAFAADDEGSIRHLSFDLDWGELASSYEARITIEGSEAIAVVRDVTEQHRLQASLVHQATHDELTGLANRRLFSEHLERALDHGRVSGAFPGVLFIDLDQFKVLNDSQGHDVGDTVLRAAAQRLSQAIRPGDVVARLGGDEFAVLCHRIDMVDDAVRLAERIVAATAEPVEVDGESVVITASVGVVVASAESSTASVLRDADTAMYQAKANGRRRVELFTEGIRAAALARHQVEHDLRRALESDELELYYQPLWSLASQRWVGVEALVRWNHPVRGLLAPGVFLPVAADAGLMPALGTWVLNRACADVAGWRDTVPSPIRTWINLSSDQLMSECLVDDVIAALDARGLPRTVLGVEVTETAVVGDITTARANLGRLRTLGVNVALDDFGTGLSSLTHLDGLPLDVVKLDGAFVAGAGVPGRQRDLVDGIVTLVRRLGLEVLAERVESAEELAALAELGVDSLQGYFLGRPMPVSQLVTFLTANPAGASA